MALLCFQGIFLNLLGVVQQTTLKTGRVNHTTTAFVFLFFFKACEPRETEKQHPFSMHASVICLLWWQETKYNPLTSTPLNVGPTCNSNKWDVARCQTTHSRCHRCRLRKQALTLLIKTLNSRKWKISAKHRSNTPINPHSGTTCFVGHTLPDNVEKTPVLAWSDLIF